MPTAFSLILLTIICIGSSLGFVAGPPATSQQRKSKRYARADMTSLRPTLLEVDNGATDEDGEQFELQISDDETLRISAQDGSTTSLLCGVSPSTWSAGTTTSSGLFLHSKNPNGESSTFDTSLGQLASCNRLVACARLTRYWMGPAFGKSAKDIPLDTQFLLVEVQEGGPYALVLPLLDGDFRTSLVGSRKNEIVCHQESGDEKVKTSGTRAVYIGVGDDPYELIRHSFAAVANETKTFSTIDKKTIPSHVDEFGWCTWDAFYSEVAPHGVIEGVKSLREAGAPPKTVILDDGWQQVEPKKKGTEMEVAKEDPSNGESKQAITSRVASGILSIFAKVVSILYERFVRKARHNSVPNKIWRFLTRTVLKGQMWGYFDDETDFARQLSGFEANEKFQKNTDDDTSIDLKELVARLKTELDVTRLFCWHALHGYWRGVSPDLGSKAGFNATNTMPHLSDHLLSVEPILAWDSVSLFGVGLVPDEKDLATFYNNLHSPLIAAGVDGVKVDVQSGLASLGGGNGGGSRIARMYVKALENSVSARFTPENGGPSCINCMCHSTENLYHYQTTAVARASDDFYPTRSDSHTVHLVNVAYNSLFIGEICLPDWDMFTSTCEAAELHAAARAVSGGPVYVSDKPGEHNGGLLKRLVLKDGSVLRCLRPGRPTRDCLFADVGKDRTSILKVWNENPCGGVIGLFNSQGVAWNFLTHENEVVNKSPPPLTASTKAHDVESLRGLPGPFIAFQHRTSRLEHLQNGRKTIETTLAPKEWDIITFVPVRQAESEAVGSISWAPIGLADMMNSGGSVLDATEINLDGKRPSTMISTRGPGRFVAYCRPEPSQISLIDDPTAPTNLPYTYHEQGP